MKWSRQTVAIVIGLAAIGVLAGITGGRTASSQTMTLRAFAVEEQPSMDPAGDLWRSVPGVAAPITAQTVTYPNGGGSVPSVTLKALHYDNVLYVRVSWQDHTKDSLPQRVTSFTDAVALEFPAKSAVAVPSFCMGQANAGVNIWQWRADSQARGSAATASQVHPYAFSDGYPEAFEKDPIYQPASALANPVATPTLAVQNLVAQAFGTLAAAPVQAVDGQGAWDRREWSVVFSRPFAGADPSQADFAVGTLTNMAVAVWNGEAGDRGGQKTVSPFVTLDVSNTTFKPKESKDALDVLGGMVISGGAVLVGIAVAMLIGTWILRGTQQRQDGV